METKIWINELNCEVEFEGTVDYDPPQKGDLETEPLPEQYRVENATWQKDKYTEKENSIIENYVEQAENEMIDEYEMQEADSYC